MPELPDVERFKRQLDAVLLHRSVHNDDVKDMEMLSETTPERLRAQLRAASFHHTERHGGDMQ